ncbi:MULTISPECIES: plasmid mobilization relaxosome protein MobC [unclassified Roseovarius]|uniref:plasmid mobilization relaxosome protein MobC n=1 Tax=unclassified Roseovarius TaxID=2614913 RepID=UPI00273E9085|nr:MULTISPECIES: plasmid mobilization relaxosome protein MobC [unclassified Roseovarius]
MPQKSELVRARVAPASKTRFEAVAAEHGLSPSEFLRQVIETVSGEADVPDQKQTKARREGKVTVRLGQGVRQSLEREAKSQHVPVSTWASRLLTARVRSAPQPVTGERKIIQTAFRQLRGMATNLNQMATVMNRGVFTGDSYAPTKEELQTMRREVQALRTELAKYAGGRFRFQIGEEAGSE